MVPRTLLRTRFIFASRTVAPVFFYTISTQVHLLALSFVLFNIMGGLNKHTTTTASWVENPTLSRRKDFNHVTDNRCRGEEFTAALTFRQCKFTQKVFINLTEYVKLYIRRNILKSSSIALPIRADHLRC